MAGIKTSLLLPSAALAFFTASACAAIAPASPDALWLQGIKQQAVAQGISPEVVSKALDGFVPNPRVIKLDRKQPEGTTSFKAYKARTVTRARIQKGARLLSQHGNNLRSLQARTGVPPEIVLALWAIESNYGQNSGSYEVVNSLATLAFEGRRGDFFRKELFAALHILDRTSLPSQSLRGSWAGAMGQCQFMPSTYLRFAVDSQGGGVPDIWNDELDVMASIANYLAAEGWKRGQEWGRAVKRFKGRKASTSALASTFVQPDGPKGPSFIVTDNVRAIMKWNKSTYFALSVGLLADAIKAESKGRHR